jgi:hypothetical protein
MDDGLIGPASGAISAAGYLLRLSSAGGPQRSTSAPGWSIRSVYEDQEEGTSRCGTGTAEEDNQGQKSPAASSTAAGHGAHTFKFTTANTR